MVMQQSSFSKMGRDRWVEAWEQVKSIGSLGLIN